MKIVSITTVKNEADIIESFVRYHLNIVDEMIILNNGSTDDTNYILNQLLNEKLPITVIDDKDKYFKPVQKMNFLLKKAIQEFGADIVCPIDVDEFITSDTGNPRDFIEQIDQFTYYKLKWRTYVPTKDDDVSEKFIPSRMTHIRDENLEEYKVILHRNLFDEFDASLTVGSHELQFDRSKYGNTIKCEICDDLIMAHFPLRSKEQTISKVLVSYPNLLCRIEVNPNLGFHRSHYAPMFFKIKQNGDVSEDDVIEFAKRYSTKGNEVDDDEEIIIVNKPMNFDFCDAFSIKYDYVLRPLSNVLEHYTYLAKEVNKFKKDKINETDKFKVYSKKLDKFKNQPNNNNNNNHPLDSQQNKLIENNKYLIEINNLNEELFQCRNAISELKYQLNDLKGNAGTENIIKENENTINVLLSKNEKQESTIRKLTEENEILKNKLNDFN